MKRSEYKKEINRLIKLSQELDERLEIQWKTSMWLDKQSTDLSTRIDNADRGNYRLTEELGREVKEMLGRIRFEKNLSKSDQELEDTLYQELDILTIRVIKEGIKEG